MATSMGSKRQGKKTTKAKTSEITKQQDKATKKTAKKTVKKATKALRKRVTARKKAQRGNQDDAVALRKRVDKLTGLLDVAKAMIAERDLDTLLNLILNEAVRIIEADRCTLWIVDRDRNEIWTRVAQGLLGDEKIRIPIGVGIAGQVAATGHTINIPDAYADERFNRQVDKDTGYRTRHILGVPMRSMTGEITGVLQALNKLESAGTCFSTDDEDLALALGAHAAAAIENAILYEEIDRLFEGFVKASVMAIEARDPTTSGHSERVAMLTTGMAESIEHLDTGPYADLHFTRDDMREIRYAALLHDFGKVGVRENVLVKACKLYPGELEMIETRFRALKNQRSNAHLTKIIAALRQGGELPHEIDESAKRDLKELEEFLEFVRQCNQPTVLASGDFGQLRDIAQVQYTNAHGTEAPLLNDIELQRLSIPRGTLDQKERLEIESHVAYTFQFLAQIPWTRNLRHVPEIAYAHHEKLDGSGYPRQLQADQIPVQSRMMTIADIYDALTASDRPYKKALTHERAIDILHQEVKMKRLDCALLELFIESKIHHVLKRPGA